MGPGDLRWRIMKPTLQFLFLLATLSSVLSPGARALPDAEATAGRLALRRYGDAVVAVRLTVVLKVSLNGRNAPPSESTVDVNGTVITPEGVTVTSLNAVDPKMIFESMRSQMGPSAMGADLLGSEVKALRLRLADGREIPARILGREPALDIVLIGPAAPAPAGGATYTFVDLRESPDAATVLGTCFHLVRLGDALQRPAVVRPGAIIAVLERPSRRFLVDTDFHADGLGCPVFDAQGRVLGICLRQLVDSVPKGMVVIPSADVARQVAQQVGNE